MAMNGTVWDGMVRAGSGNARRARMEMGDVEQQRSSCAKLQPKHSKDVDPGRFLPVFDVAPTDNSIVSSGA